MPELLLKPNPSLFKAVVPDLKLASDVPPDSEVYIFYIPGISNIAELQKTLTEWGETTGKNAFVGLLSPDAPDYKTIVTYFKIRKSPAVVVSGAPAFASDEERAATTGFARIDNSRLLNDQAQITDCLQELYNLFIQAKVKEAINLAKQDSFKQDLRYYFGKLKDSSGKAINDFLKTHDVTIDVFQGKIVLSPTVQKSAAAATTSSPADGK